MAIFGQLKVLYECGETGLPSAGTLSEIVGDLARSRSSKGLPFQPTKCLKLAGLHGSSAFPKEIAARTLSWPLTCASSSSCSASMWSCKAYQAPCVQTCESNKSALNRLSHKGTSSSQVHYYSKHEINSSQMLAYRPLWVIVESVKRNLLL